MKKASILACALAVLLASLAACGTSPSSAAPPAAETSQPAAGAESEAGDQGTWETDTSPITFDVYMNASWAALDWSTDVETRSTTLVTETTGVTINFQIPAGSEAEKMNTMTASGDLPDMVMASTYDLGVKEFIDAGHALPLVPLAEQYDSTFFDIVTPSQITWYTHSDGNMYAYPNFCHSYDIAREKLEADDQEYLSQLVGDICFLVRKDIYEAIGSPDMTQPEGFLQALADAKAQFPTVDGSPLIPIEFAEMTETGGSLVNYISALAGLPAYDEEGNMMDGRTHPEVVRWLKTLREANEMGLVSKDVLIDQRAQREEKMKRGQYFVTLSGRADTAGNNDFLYKDMGGAETGIYYIAVDGMFGTETESAIPAKLMLDGWMDTYITTKCEDPARALRFLNYMMGYDGQRDIYFGKEGVTFDYVDGVPIFKDFVLDGSVPIEELDRDYYVYGSNWAWWNSNIMIEYENYQEKPFGPNVQIMEWGVPYMVLRPEISAPVLEAGSEAAIAQSNIGVEWGTTLVKLITAPSEAEFDQILEEYIATRDQLGYDLVVAANNAYIANNRAKLGME